MLSISQWSRALFVNARYPNMSCDQIHVVEAMSEKWLLPLYSPYFLGSLCQVQSSAVYDICLPCVFSPPLLFVCMCLRLFTAKEKEIEKKRVLARRIKPANFRSPASCEADIVVGLLDDPREGLGAIKERHHASIN